VGLESGVDTGFVDLDHEVAVVPALLQYGLGLTAMRRPAGVVVIAG
jgi:hypothetical protein